MIMKCETQQQPILEPNQNGFFSDQTGWPLAGLRRAQPNRGRARVFMMKS